MYRLNKQETAPELSILMSHNLEIGCHSSSSSMVTFYNNSTLLKGNYAGNDK